MLPAPFAVFLKLKLPLHGADVLMCPVIVTLAGGTLETDEVWLGHKKTKSLNV